MQSLLKETEVGDADYDNLVKVSDLIGNVAVKINFIKKRFDIVDKYVQGKGTTNVMYPTS